MNALAEKHALEIESCIPDICDGTDEAGTNAAVYDHACDYIYDREHKTEKIEDIRAAAQEIADHYCGKEQA